MYCNILQCCTILQMQKQTKKSRAAKSGTPNALHTHIQTHKHYATLELRAMHCPIHFSLHSKKYCLRPRMLTLKHLELLTSGRPLCPFRLCYHKAEK